MLNDSGVTIDGVKFWGSPWQPEFCDWAFNLPRGRPLKEHWDAIPEKTDVLATHTPPKGVLDRVWRTTHTVDHNTRLYDPEEKRPQFRRFRNHVGCADLMQAVYRVQPRLHIFGHIHCDRGVVHGTKRAPRTTFINAAICNERYQPEHPPIIFDL